MRNRFKPNLTPRGSQRTTRATTAEAGASAKGGHGETQPKSAFSDSSTVSSPREKEEEPQTAGSSNSDANPGSNVDEPDNSGTVQGIPAAASAPAGQTRRSRIKPSVTSITRQRQSGSKTRNISKPAEPRRQPVAEKNDQQSSQSSDSQTAEVTTTAGSSLPETEQHSQPVVTQESNTEKSRETPAQPANSSTPAREQNAEQQLSRRKRPFTNLPEPAPQRRRSSSAQRETSDNTAQHKENVVEKEETPAEASNFNDKEEAQAGKKRANLDREQQNPDSESRTDAASQGKEGGNVEDGDDANPKKPPKAKRRRGSRSFKPKEPADISKMTMQDLIYYNPKTNPMKSSLDAKKKNHESRRKSSNRNDADMREENEERSVLEAAQPEGGPNVGERHAEDSGAMSVAPQVKLAADGSIILDEESLIIHTQEDHSLDNSEVVYEDTNQVNFAAYKKHKKVERWSLEETLVFYKALSQVGTDFSLMGPIFPKRSRRELKSKFKREEKLHREQIEKALSHRAPIDVELFAPQVEGEELDGDVIPSETKN